MPQAPASTTLYRPGMTLPGNALVDYIKSQIPGVTNAQIAKWAGVTTQRVVDWSHTRAQGWPLHHEVIALGRAAEKEYPYNGVSPFELLTIAGFEFITHPDVERRARLMKEWAELTVQLQDADNTTLWRTLSAAQKAMRSA